MYYGTADTDQDFKILSSFVYFSSVQKPPLMLWDTINNISFHTQTIISKTNEATAEPRGGHRVGLPQHRVLRHRGVGRTERRLRFRQEWFRLRVRRRVCWYWWVQRTRIIKQCVGHRWPIVIDDRTCSVVLYLVTVLGVIVFSSIGDYFVISFLRIHFLAVPIHKLQVEHPTYIRKKVL